jgi:cytochrome b561
MKSGATKAILTESEWHYRRPAIMLHWLLAILIVAQVALGLYMMSIADDPGSERYFNLHMSLGLMIGTLVLLRVAWRLTHKPERLPSSVAPWEVRASQVTQWLLYACMLAMPVTGYLGASFSTDGVVLFGVPLSAWASSNKELSDAFFSVHFLIAAVLVVLVGIHVLGGLKHLLIDKDRVFQRMWH